MIFDPKVEIEGYAEAVEKQDFVRDAAFLGVPETIAGIQVAPLTFRHLLWLQIIKSPFIGFSQMQIEALHLAIAGFFKTVAPLAKPSFMLTQFDRADHKNLKRYMRQVGRLKAPVAVAAINDFITDAFMDSLGGTSDHGENYYSVGAALTHSLAKNYPSLNANPGIFPGALDVPLKVGFQMLKLIKRENLAAAGKPAVMFNGLSDQIKTRWLEQQNTNN